MGGAGDIHCLFRTICTWEAGAILATVATVLGEEGTGCLHSDPFPSPCLTWWKGLERVEGVHIVSANCTLFSFKTGLRASLGSCSGLVGSFGFTFSRHLFFLDHDPQSPAASLGVLGKWHKGSHFVGLRRQP